MSVSVTLLSRVFNEKINKILQNFFFKNKKKEERKKCIELDEMHRRLLMFRTTR